MSGSGAPVGVRSNQAANAPSRSKPVRKALKQTVDGLHGQLFLAKLHDEGHDGVLAPTPGPVLGPLLPVGQGRLVAVMPVRDKHGLLLHQGAARL